MATIRSFTSLEQSKKLAKILPLESSDMHYMYLGTEDKEYEDIPICAPAMEGDLCAWSLAALYGILPNNKKESTTLSRGGWKIAPPEYIDNWWCEYEDERHTEDFTVSADNPVDACYEMIIKLHELNLL